jgi:hypothetical protein
MGSKNKKVLVGLGVLSVLVVTGLAVWFSAGRLFKGDLGDIVNHFLEVTPNTVDLANNPEITVKFLVPEDFTLVSIPFYLKGDSETRIDYFEFKNENNMLVPVNHPDLNVTKDNTGLYTFTYKLPAKYLQDDPIKVADHELSLFYYVKDDPVVRNYPTSSPVSIINSGEQSKTCAPDFKFVDPVSNLELTLPDLITMTNDTDAGTVREVIVSGLEDACVNDFVNTSKLTMVTNIPNPPVYPADQIFDVSKASNPGHLFRLYKDQDVYKLEINLNNKPLTGNMQYKFGVAYGGGEAEFPFTVNNCLPFAVVEVEPNALVFDNNQSSRNFTAKFYNGNVLLDNTRVCLYNLKNGLNFTLFNTDNTEKSKGTDIYEYKNTDKLISVENLESGTFKIDLSKTSINPGTYKLGVYNLVTESGAITLEVKGSVPAPTPGPTSTPPTPPTSGSGSGGGSGSTSSPAPAAPAPSPTPTHSSAQEKCGGFADAGSFPSDVCALASSLKEQKIFTAPEFNPNQDLQRYQAALLVVRTAKLSEKCVPGALNIYKDIDQKAEYFNELCVANNAKVITGYEADPKNPVLLPARRVNFREFSKMLYNGYIVSGKGKQPRTYAEVAKALNFQVTKDNDWFGYSLQFLVNQGVLSLDELKKTPLDKNLTRLDVAKFLDEFLKDLK